MSVYARTRRVVLSLFVLALPQLAAVTAAQPGPCTVEVEPNDTPATATAVVAPGCIEGSFAIGDQDAFLWRVDEAAATVPWRLSVEGIPAQVTQVDVLRVTFADDGVGVLAAEGLIRAGTSDGSVQVSDAFWIAPGEYVLGVSTSGGTGPYRIEIAHAEHEGVTRFDGPSVAVAGPFAVAGDQRAGPLTVTWEVGPDAAGLGWRVDVAAAVGERVHATLRTDGVLLKEGTADGSTLEWTDLELQAGRYVVELAPTNDRPAPVVVRAVREAVGGPATEREPNDTWESAGTLPTSEPLTGRLTAGDVDHFTFAVDEVMAGQLYDLLVETEAMVEVALYDAERNVLQQRRGAGGALRSLQLAEGTYGFTIAGDEGSYRLSFRPAGSPQSGAEREPNDTPASAQALDETLTMRGHLTFDDVDLFGFEVVEGGARYRVQVLGRGDGVARVTVLDRNGRSVAEAAGDGGVARIDEVELAPGAYLVRIEGRDSEYALRMLDLGSVVEPPPVLEARTDDGEAAALTVTTVAAPESAPGPPPDAQAPGAAGAAPEERSHDAATPRTEAPPEDACATPAAGADPGGPVTLRYSDEARLACGAHLNTLVDGDDVMLDPEAAAFRFIWVAGSRRGTVIKIDTDSGDVVGEYWTAPVYDPERPSQDPSRTVVDRNGNVWVGNRADDVGGRGTVVQIGLLENGQCEDRNGNGVIDTSTGLGDVRDWDNAGDVDRMGGVATAEDECVLQYVRVHSTGVRHVSVDLDGNVWVSGTGNRHLDLIDGATGSILRSEPAPCGGYGGLVDRSGVLWSAAPLLRWDPREPLTGEVCLGGGRTYGIGLDYDDHTWMSDFAAGVCRYSHEGVVEACFDAGAGVGASRGVAVTPDNHVWVVHTGGDAVTRFAPDGAVVARIGVGGSPTGVSVDARGKPWVISGGAQRIDPETNEIDLTVNLDAAFRQGADELPYYGRAGPYVYSDMTGQLVFGPPDSGTYTLRVRGPSFRTSWATIRFEADVPDGAAVDVRVSTSDGLAAAGGLKSVRSGDALDLEGQYLYVQVTLERAPSGASPRIGGIEIDAAPVPLAPGAIRVDARPDLVASSNAIEVILDASGSMGQLLPTGESRWDAARAALMALAETAFPAGVPVALRAYGHLEPTTCHMALEHPLAPFDPVTFRGAIVGITPKLLSQTPLADAILAAAEDLAELDGQRMVVLVTDGEESCGGDPEAAIRSLRARGVATVNIIGFALQDDEVKAQFARWAELGGGTYLDTATGAELGVALNAVLQPEFVVFDPDGVEVARGRVNTAAVAVPSGVYRVQVLSSPGRIVEGVQVLEREVALTVALRE